MAEAEFYLLSSSPHASLADIMEAALDEVERDGAAGERIEAAWPELARIECLYPGRSTTRELLEAAGVTAQALGLEDGDQELIDMWLAEGPNLR
ncbi:hypothetical protein ACFWBB_31130 [Streptomyces sp. NPDC060000]|uniref:hypothetical protein n=1 Tax=Streptomyces sp. NPDC060000 TaxID=3347031 RepID=UPI00368A0091